MSGARTIATRWVPAALALGAVLFFLLRGGGQAAPPERQQRPTPVRAAAVQVGDLELREAYPGELIADAVELAPQTAGRLAEVSVHVGDRVRAGQVVARLDPAQVRLELQQAEARVRAARASAARVEARMRALRAELDRKAPLAARQLVSAQELEALEAEIGALEADRATAQAEAEQGGANAAALRERLADLSLKAPFDALVASRLLEPGTTVPVGTPVVRLVRAGPLEVRFRVPEAHAGVVRAELPLRVRTQATGDVLHQGRVLRVAGEVSRADRSLLVEGRLREESEILRAGMFATVELSRGTLESALLVPAAAVLERELGTGLFVAADGVARWRGVRVLGEEAGTTAVQGEMEAGDRVLVFGHDNLSDGAPVAVVEEVAPTGAVGGAG